MGLEDDIRAAEARLDVTLPPSYRAHVIASAGLPGDHGLMLLPLHEIDQFATRHAEWFDAWMEGVRLVPPPDPSAIPLPDDPGDPATMPHDQLGTAIVISSTGDERLLLLNPSRVDAAGEWEAWDFANWYPGAYRYPSFGYLVEALASSG